jgi:hypothetical protein
MDLNELIAREEIRDLVSRFGMACTLDDIEGFRELWTPDGVWTVGEPFNVSAEGIEAVVEMYRYLRGLHEGFFQAYHNGLIEVAPEGDRATGQWQLSEYGACDCRTQGYFNHGLYADTLVKTESGWRFARRDFRYVYLDQCVLPGTWFGVDHGAGSLTPCPLPWQGRG